MAFKLVNRARMSVTGTAGTGSLTLNAATTGFQSFSAAGLANADTTPYVIEDGSNWEIGIGTYTSSGTTFSRDTVTQSSAGGTTKISVTSAAIVTSTLRAGDVVSTLAGDSDVSITAPSSGQVLTYNGASWANAAPAAVGFTVGTPPTVVRLNSNSANAVDAAVTMGASPANGNLLVAIVYTDGTQPSAASGWTLQSISTTGLWYCLVLTRVAGASEPTSQNPVTGISSSHWTKGIWEINGQNGSAPVVVAAAGFNAVAGTLAQTTVLPQSTSTLFLASLLPASSQAYTLTATFSAATIDANLTAAAGAHAAFGHSDSHNPTYGMLGEMSASAQSNSAFVLITA